MSEVHSPKPDKQEERVLAFLPYATAELGRALDCVFDERGIAPSAVPRLMALLQASYLPALRPLAEALDDELGKPLLTASIHRIRAQADGGKADAFAMEQENVLRLWTSEMHKLDLGTMGRDLALFIADAVQASPISSLYCICNAQVLRTVGFEHFYANVAIEPVQQLWKKLGDEFLPLLREIVGSPGAAPLLDSSLLMWNQGTIPRLAQQMYESEDFGAMPILADALEDAGCTDSVIFDHCRETRMHVRGCWLIDEILGNKRRRLTVNTIPVLNTLTGSVQ